jgi:hypothetical protein
MLRKLTIAFAAAAAIGIAFVSTEALAHGGHGGGSHGGGGFHGGFHGFHGGSFGPGFGVYPYDYGYDYECYQLRRVHTPHGLRWRRVWVCD